MTSSSIRRIGLSVLPRQVAIMMMFNGSLKLLLPLALPLFSSALTLTQSPNAQPTLLARAATNDPVAASYTLTPASISSFSLPSSTLSAATAAQSYIEANWGHVSGKSDYISFVDDPFPGGGSTGKVLRVSYPNGTYAHSPVGEGGIGMYLDPFGSALDGKVKRALFTYEVAFSKDWDFVQGGKLPGLFGGRVGEHCSGGTYTNTCFSLRIVWRKDGEAEVYAYIPGYQGFDTKAGILANPDGYGYSINRGSFKFKIGEYQKVSILTLLSTSPTPSPSPTKANGQISIYIDDKHVFTHTYFVLTTNPSVDVSNLFFSSFFGGSSAPYASKGGYAYFREMKAYCGTKASESEGAMVTAVYPSA